LLTVAGIQNSLLIVAIVGANGLGKSTLLKVLAGELAPRRGTRDAHHAAHICYVGQHFDFATMAGVERHSDDALLLTPLRVMKAIFADMSLGTLRQKLGVFGLVGDLPLQCIVTLSGGQKSRLALAIAAAHVTTTLPTLLRRRNKLTPSIFGFLGATHFVVG
jgi:ATP-binding cassette subfamily F protein 3